MVSDRTLRLADFVHLQPAAEAGAVVVDDRTLTAASLNWSALVVFEALRVPRTEEDLVSVLAGLGFERSVAVAAVARLVTELTSLGWIETSRSVDER